MQQFINLTERSVDIGRRILIRSGDVATVAVIQETVSAFDGLPIVRRRFGTVEGLPELDPDGRFLYIVEPDIQRASPERQDLVSAVASLKDPGRLVLCRMRA